MARSIPCSLIGSLDGHARVAASKTSTPPECAPARSRHVLSLPSLTTHAAASASQALRCASRPPQRLSVPPCCAQLSAMAAMRAQPNRENYHRADAAQSRCFEAASVGSTTRDIRSLQTHLRLHAQPSRHRARCAAIPPDAAAALAEQIASAAHVADAAASLADSSPTATAAAAAASGDLGVSGGGGRSEVTWQIVVGAIGEFASKLIPVFPLFNLFPLFPLFPPIHPILLIVIPHPLYHPCPCLPLCRPCTNHHVPAGVIPFIVASIEFGKRIAAQQRCEACRGSGLQLVGRFYRRCSACGGFLPWQSWRRFFLG
ncbi:unnamed protein product [Closterium sp. NIES-64]|nr:unnamed protein product [Closterium sp. NIES-64]